MFSSVLQQTSAYSYSNILVFVEKDLANARKLQAQISSAAVPDERLHPENDDNAPAASGLSEW